MFSEKSHVVRIFLIIVILGVVGFVARQIALPESFGLHGHYRWEANNENRALPLINQNSNTCRTCHNGIYQLHEKDAHYNVPCVDCHGAGNLHVAYHKDSLGTVTKEQAVMPKEFKLEGCLFCHRKLKARPSDFPQIDQTEHFKFLNVTNPDTKCIDCHSPHEPIFLLTDVKQSRIHPVVYKCTECHDKKPDKSFKDVENHPTIFECKDCHTNIVKSFEERPHHKYVECRTCHLYHKENETTGRIYKNGNVKFCLLCHEKKSFKSDKYPPKIEWPSHIGNLSIIEKTDEKICLKCHADQIHEMNQNTNDDPHPKNWVREHKEFAKSNSQICQKCHNTNKCSSCHLKTKPLSHTADWLKLHSKNAAGNKSSCDFCHRQNSCANCHKVEIPHPKGWEDNHKEVVSQKGREVCAKCHKEDFCKQCH